MEDGAYLIRRLHTQILRPASRECIHSETEKEDDVGRMAAGETAVVPLTLKAGCVAVLLDALAGGMRWRTWGWT